MLSLRAERLTNLPLRVGMRWQWVQCWRWLCVGAIGMSKRSDLPRYFLGVDGLHLGLYRA